MQSSYCPSPYRYTRRVTREVMVGNVGVGGSNPIRIQSMLTSDTRDTDACVKEALELAEAGCEIIRLTAQTKAYAANLENIARELRAAGCHVPLVADIHFKPDAAMEAAKWVEKIRINPGNFVDKKKFEVREYSDAEYREELDRLREEFTPLVLFCREHGRAMRIGSNHGSLSDRILNRFGDTPEGMVESAIEFAQIARDLDYHSLVFSMKASNVKVMVAAYRLLVERMNALGPDWNYPIHLGVTEAGGGEDGRIKSAVGIGSLLTGMKTTIKVYFRKKVTEQYPENRAELKMFDRFRGTLNMPHNENNEHRCVACGLCQMACPNDTIKVTSETIETEEGKKKKILAKYEYDLGSCIFCQLCVNACPHDAITFDQVFEHAVFDRTKLVLQLNREGSKVIEKKKE